MQAPVELRDAVDLEISGLLDVTRIVPP